MTGMCMENTRRRQLKRARENRVPSEVVRAAHALEEMEPGHPATKPADGAPPEDLAHEIAEANEEAAETLVNTPEPADEETQIDENPKNTPRSRRR